jgi:hypothetical protein
MWKYSVCPSSTSSRRVAYFGIPADSAAFEQHKANVDEFLLDNLRQ